MCGLLSRVSTRGDKTNLDGLSVDGTCRVSKELVRDKKLVRIQFLENRKSSLVER